MHTHTEISRQGPNLFSAEQVAKTIGTDLETVNEWLEVGAIDRAVFGGGQFSKNELLRAALVFELVKCGLSPSCAKDAIREMEYELAPNLGNNTEQLQSLCDTNSNKQEVVSFLVLEGNNRENRPAHGGRSYYSTCFPHPGSRDG